MGSGNLTEAGLLGNWEAYSVEQFDSEAMNAMETTWDDWKLRHAGSLLPLDDPAVRERASANTWVVVEGDLPTLVAAAPPEAPTEEPATTLVMSGVAEVLVAEIPSSNKRWKQANFHKVDYEGFFRAKAGKLFVFGHVNDDGTRVDWELNRKPVSVKSHNFRFELAAASGIPYPDANAGRPVGVFIRVAARRFFYRLVLPDDSEYDAVSDLLQRNAGPPKPKMRTVRMTVEQLRTQWPNSPFWQLPANV